jgi:hypothetical protein
LRSLYCRLGAPVPRPHVAYLAAALIKRRPEHEHPTSGYYGFRTARCGRLPDIGSWERNTLTRKGILRPVPVHPLEPSHGQRRQGGTCPQTTVVGEENISTSCAI